MKFAAAVRLPLGLGSLCLLLLTFAGPGMGQKAGVEIVSVFKGHGDAVYSVALTPDHKHLVTGSFDTTVKLWDLATGKEARTYGGPNGHNKMVLAVAVSPDGALLASAGADNQLRLWDVPVNAPVKTDPLSHPVQRLALSADATKLAAGGADGKVTIVNVADNKELAKFESSPPLRGGSATESRSTNTNPVTSLAWSGNGQLVVSGGADGSLRFLNLAKNETVTVGAHRGGVHQVQVHPNGTIFSVGGDGMMRLWNAPPAPSRTLTVDAVSVASALSSDGTLLALAGADRGIRLIAPATAKEVRTLTGASADLTAVAINANSTLVAAAQQDGYWSLWNVADGKQLALLPGHAAKIPALAFHPQAPQLATAGTDGMVKLWTLPPPANAARLVSLANVGAIDAHAAGVVAVQFNANGTQLLTAGADRTVKVWDVAKKAALKTYGPVADPIHAAGFSRDYQLVAAASGKTLKLWNLADDKEVASLPHPADVRTFAFKADKSRVVTGGEDKQTRVWELPAGRELQYTSHADPVQAHLDAPGNILVSVAGRSVLFETPLGQRAVPVDAGPVFGLAFPTNNNNFAYTVGADKTVKIWNLGNFTQEKTAFAAAGGPLRAVAVTKNNVLLAAAGDDKVVRIHTLPDGKELAAAPVDAAVVNLTFSVNGQLLLATLADKKIVAFTTTFNPGQPPPPDFLKPAQTFTVPHAVVETVMLPDNATLLIGGPDKSVQHWKIASVNPVKSFPHPNIVDSVAFHPKAAILASGCHDGKLRLWDLVKGVQLKEIAAHLDKTTQHPIYSVVFSPDGSKVLTASYDKTLKLYDTASGNFIRELKAYHPKDAPHGHQDEVYAAAFSLDGKLIASGSGGQERVIKLWKADDGAFVRDLVNPELTKDPKAPAISHPGWIYHVRFTQAGRLISAGDAPKNGGYLAVWNPADGKLLTAEATHFGALFGFALSADEKLLAVGAGSRGRVTGEVNHAYLLRVPGINK